ncbi:MAG: hypothetical protein ACREFQ_23335 [Stellaceae bacterium]
MTADSAATLNDGGDDVATAGRRRTKVIIAGSLAAAVLYFGILALAGVFIAHAVRSISSANKSPPLAFEAPPRDFASPPANQAAPAPPKPDVEHATISAPATAESTPIAPPPSTAPAKSDPTAPPLASKPAPPPLSAQPAAVPAPPQSAPFKPSLTAPTLRPEAKPVPSSTQPTAAPSGAAEPSAKAPPVPPEQASPATTPRSSPEADGLVAAGDQRLDQGDIAAARLFFARASELGNGKGAFRMGQSFDPEFLARLGVRGMSGDPAEAARWYRRALKLGEPRAAAALAALVPRQLQEKSVRP